MLDGVSIQLPSPGIFELALSSDSQAAVITQFENGQVLNEVARLPIATLESLTVTAAGTGHTDFVHRLSLNLNVTFAGSSAHSDALYDLIPQSGVVLSGTQAGRVQHERSAVEFSGVATAVLGNGIFGQTLTLTPDNDTLRLIPDSGLTTDPTSAGPADANTSLLAAQIPSAGLTLVYPSDLSGHYFYINSGLGNDSIDSREVSLPLSVFGDVGADTILGGPSNDSFYGGPGDDVLDGGDGGDYVFGGEGDDLVQAGAVNSNYSYNLIGGDEGDDTVDGGVGSAVLVHSQGLVTVVGNTVQTPQGDDILQGQLWQVFIYGHYSEPDLIDASASDLDVFALGYGGNDTLIGSNGSCLLFGGDGDDVLIGGENRSFIHGDSGNDQLIGGDGDDDLEGGPGNDTIEGGVGNNRLIYSSATEATVVGMSVNISGEQDVILSAPSTVVISGDDSSNYFDASQSAVRVEFNGAGGDDTLIGSPFDDYLFGYAGNDVIEGGSGHDYLVDGDGDDTVRSQGGNDQFENGAGNDTFDGGEEGLYYVVNLYYGDAAIVGQTVIQNGYTDTYVGDGYYFFRGWK